MFDVNYQPIAPDHPECGTAAILDWDARIFGFNVADYKLGDVKLIAQNYRAFQNALQTWAEAHAVELISCHISGEDAILRALLPRWGFSFVDFTMQILQAKIQETDFPAPRAPASFATLADRAQVEQIVENAFRFGRYHADARFPKEIANRRYALWMRDIFSKLGDEHRIYIARADARIIAMTHLQFEGDASHITIFAVERTKQGLMLGTELGDQMMNDLKQRGIKSVDSRVSAANGAVINLAVARGYRISLPQAIYHWHAPNARHLVGWDALPG